MRYDRNNKGATRRRLRCSSLTKIIGKETDNLTFDGRGIDCTVEEEASYFASIEVSITEVFYVVREEGIIVGTGSYFVHSSKRMSHRGEFGMAIRKSHWNRGIGTMLLEKILNFAKDISKSEVVSLEVRSDNLAAIHLYEKAGFEKVGTFKGYFKIEDQLIDFDIMQLILTTK